MSLTEEASEGAAAASAPPNSSPTTAAPTYDASLFVKGMFVDAWCAQEHAWQPATIVALSDGQAKVHFQQHYSTIADVWLLLHGRKIAPHGTMTMPSSIHDSLSHSAAQPDVAELRRNFKSASMATTTTSDWPFDSALAEAYTPPSLRVSSTTAVIVIDWTSLLFGVLRAQLPLLVRALVQYTRDLGIKSVVRIVVLFDPEGPFAELELSRPYRAALDMEDNCAVLFLERCWLAWTPRVSYPHPPWTLTNDCLQQVTACTEARNVPSSTSLLLFVTSRPSFFVSALNHVLGQKREILLMHGHGKQPMGLPYNIAMMHRPPVDSQEFSFLREKKVQTDQAKSLSSSSWLSSRTIAARAMVADAWAIKGVDGKWRLDGILCANLRRLLGVQCVWDLPMWVAHEAQLDVAFGGRVQIGGLGGLHACPTWNADDQKCLSTNVAAASTAAACAATAACCLPHVCQGCGGMHALSHCPGNNMLLLHEQVQRSQCPDVVFEAFRKSARERMQIFPSSDDMNDDMIATFALWFELSLLGAFIGRESTSEAEAESALPRDAVIFVDWQNVHVPLSEVECFLAGLRHFALTKGKAARVRRMTVLIDIRPSSSSSTLSNETTQVVALLHRLASNDTSLQVVPLNATRVEVDRFMQQLLLSRPHALTATRGADAVVVVSGDADFSPNMARLVQLGLPVLLVHNTQAQLGFKTNALWDVRQDYMLLPEMAAYHATKMAQRAERKREKRTQEELVASSSSQGAVIANNTVVSSGSGVTMASLQQQQQLPLDRHPHMRMRTHFKSRPCKHFQKGTCTWMAEADKCAFLHQCSHCGDQHGERQCESWVFSQLHPYIVVREHASSRPIAYQCLICSCLVGTTLSMAEEHVSIQHPKNGDNTTLSVNLPACETEVQRTQDSERVLNFQRQFCAPEPTDPCADEPATPRYTIPRLSSAMVDKLETVRERLPCLLSFGIGERWRLTLVVSIRRWLHNNNYPYTVKASSAQRQVMLQQIFKALKAAQVVTSALEFTNNVEVLLTYARNGVIAHALPPPTINSVCTPTPKLDSHFPPPFSSSSAIIANYDIGNYNSVINKNVTGIPCASIDIGAVSHGLAAAGGGVVALVSVPSQLPPPMCRKCAFCDVNQVLIQNHHGVLCCSMCGLH